jgi:hypothetical protein
MHGALKNAFPPFTNGSELSAAIESLCAEFGKVGRKEFVPARTSSGIYCACFLRLDSTAAEEAFLGR